MRSFCWIQDGFEIVKPQTNTQQQQKKKKKKRNTAEVELEVVQLLKLQQLLFSLPVDSNINMSTSASLDGYSGW